MPAYLVISVYTYIYKLHASGEPCAKHIAGLLLSVSVKAILPLHTMPYLLIPNVLHRGGAYVPCTCQNNVDAILQGTRMISENDLRTYLDKFDKKYWATYKVLDILQKVFYRSV